MKTVPIGSYNCSLQEECSIATTGRCVNGLDVDECTNAISVTKASKETPTGDSQATISSQATTKKTTVKLPWGEAFDNETLPKISYKYPTKLILVAGEPSSGKSTLYAALFDSFQKGGCGEYLFASTKTPIAFERICHLAREKSRGKLPLTERTKSYEFAYLHLAVKHLSFSKETQHLIFADVNGEVFQNAKDSDDDLRKLTILKRSDHLFFIADGGLLMNTGERHAAKNDVHKLIGRCIQNGILPIKERVTIIVTKWDEIWEAGKQKEVEDLFIKPTLERFSKEVSQVIKVASRSMNPDVPSRAGVDEFLKICVSQPVDQNPYNYIPPITRQYQRFKYGTKQD